MPLVYRLTQQRRNHRHDILCGIFNYSVIFTRDDDFPSVGFTSFELYLPSMEGSPSGLWRRLGKAVCGQLHRGFESLSLRHIKRLTERWVFL